MIDRTKSIGGSDIAAIVGLSPYATAFDVYCEKIGLTDPKEANQAMIWGTKLQRLIADHYAEQHPTDTVQWSDEPIYQDGWMRVTPDGLIGKDGLLEVKTSGIRSSKRWGAEGTDQIPEEYICQVQWQMGILKKEYAIVAVLIAGNDYREYRVEFDDRMFDALVTAGKSFWEQHVLKQLPPEIDTSDGASEYLKQKFPEATGEVRAADEDEISLAKKLKMWRKTAKGATEMVDLLENQLKEKIGEAKGIQGEGFKITWSGGGERAVTDWKELAKTFPIPPAIVEKYTKRSVASRRFLSTFTEGE